jgi:hypothetical protein
LLIAAAHWALSLTLFCSILFATNYFVRKKYFPVTSITCIMLLSLGFCFGISFLLEQWKSVPPVHTAGVQLGEKGVILSNSMNRNAAAVILLEGTANPYGPRVNVIPGQPLAFHETLPAESLGANLLLPPVPFEDDNPWFLNSLAIDIKLNAQIFQQHFTEGFFHYLIYVSSIIFLLCSLGYVIKFSVWPLANFFLAMLAFRGILSLGTFFNTPEMLEIIDSFLDGIMPIAFALPFFFLVFGVLMHMYSIMTIIVKKRVDDGY